MTLSISVTAVSGLTEVSSTTLTPIKLLSSAILFLLLKITTGQTLLTIIITTMPMISFLPLPADSLDGLSL